MTYEFILTAFLQGLGFTALGIGIFLSLRIFNIPDITTDGSYTTGGAVTAAMLIAGIHPLIVLPVAIISQEESVYPGIPLELLHFIDPSEPLFNQSGWHPLVFYHKVQIVVGRPYWITSTQREQYRGKQGKAIVHQLTEYCQTEISDLLRQERVY